MSYEKAMKRTNGHRHDKDYQPVLMSLSGTNIESLASISRRLATGYNVRVYDKEKREYIQVSEEFKTEDEAVDFIYNNLSEYEQLASRIYSTEGLHVSGW